MLITFPLFIFITTFPMLAIAFVDYNIPSNVEELLLKAEIADDKKWSNFWRKYMTA